MQERSDVRGRSLSRANVHVAAAFTVHAFYKGSLLVHASTHICPYLQFNGVDWFLQNVLTVYRHATTVSVSIRASSVTAISTAMMLVMNETAVRISLDRHVFRYFINNRDISGVHRYLSLRKMFHISSYRMFYDESRIHIKNIKYFVKYPNYRIFVRGYQVK